MLFMKNIVCDDPFEELKFMGVNAIKPYYTSLKSFNVYFDQSTINYS